MSLKNKFSSLFSSQKDRVHSMLCQSIIIYGDKREGGWCLGICDSYCQCQQILRRLPQDQVSGPKSVFKNRLFHLVITLRQFKAKLICKECFERPGHGFCITEEQGPVAKDPPRFRVWPYNKTVAGKQIELYGTCWKFNSCDFEQVTGRQCHFRHSCM